MNDSEELSDDAAICFVPIDGFIVGSGWRVSIVYPGQGGHTPTGTWPYEGKPGQTCPWFVPGPSYEEAEQQVADMNSKRGISPLQATLGVLKSMQKLVRRHEAR